MINQIIANNDATGQNPISTGIYTQITAVTSITASSILATDTSGKILKLAIGASGQEVDLYQLPSGSRLSLQAIDATTTTGYTVVTLLG